MVSFRFHIVSIAAIFLAIAIGVVVGSTFVDRAIVDGLEDRIDTVSANLDDRTAEIGQLQDELERSDDELEASLSFAVSGRLPETPLLVIAPRGVDDEPIRRLIELARQAGASAPGILWVEPRWALEGDGAVDELATLVDTGSSSADVVRRRAWQAVVAELQAAEPADTQDEAATEPPPESPEIALETTTTTIAEAVPSTFSALLEGGYVTFESFGDGANLLSLIQQSPRAIVVTGTSAEAALAPLMGPIVDELVARQTPTVVAEAYVEPDEDDDSDPPGRGELALEAASEAPLEAVSIVDDLDQPIGAVASILALADLDDGISGHYGYGDGASSILPAWTPP